MYALFHNGKQVGKAHSTWSAAQMEAIKLGAWYYAGAHFDRDQIVKGLTDGYEIREVEE